MFFLHFLLAIVCFFAFFLVLFLMMEERRMTILQAIVKSFINSASPVGSRFLQETFSFPCSPATIRSEMGKLEQEGYLESPHTSAGRVPTEQGFRFFVAHCVDDVAAIRPSINREFSQQLAQYLQNKKADEAVYDAVSVLTRMTPNVVFATIPSSERMFFMGFSNALRQPEFSLNPDVASGVFRVLEDNFYSVLESLGVEEEPQIFIGSENVIPEIQSCSLIVSRFRIRRSEGYIGVLGPMRIDYARNIAALETAQQFLRSRS
jgi:heat-inducible transcriptional repressor